MMTDLKKTLAAIILTLGALACGAFGIWLALVSSLQEPEIDHAVGTLATVEAQIGSVPTSARSGLAALCGGYFTFGETVPGRVYREVY